LILLLIFTCFNSLLFSDVNISQGIVATCLRSGGIFDDYFITNLLPSLLGLKIFENRLKFVDIMDRNIVAAFLTRGVVVA